MSAVFGNQVNGSFSEITESQAPVSAIGKLWEPAWEHEDVNYITHDQLVKEFNDLKEEFNGFKLFFSKYSFSINEEIKELKSLLIKGDGRKKRWGDDELFEQARGLLERDGFVTVTTLRQAGIRFKYTVQRNRLMWRLGTIPGYLCEKTDPSSRTSPLRVRSIREMNDRS
jgi:hypothetical protein